jgi:hypothetical protein
MTIEELVKCSGDSQLIDYKFLDQKLVIEIEVDELDAIATITALTDSVYAGKLDHSTEVLNICRVELIELANCLNISNGYYIPNSDFGLMMKEVQRGTSLAYGRKKSKFGWILNIVGYSRLLSCLLSSKDSVVVELKDE